MHKGKLIHLQPVIDERRVAAVHAVRMRLDLMTTDQIEALAAMLNATRSETRIRR